MGVRLRTSGVVLCLIACWIQDLLFSIGYTRLVHPGVSCLAPNTRITDLCYHMELFMGSGDLNLGPHSCTASSLTTRTLSQPKVETFTDFEEWSFDI